MSASRDGGRPWRARVAHWLSVQLELRSRQWSVASLPEHARGGFDCLETVEMLLRHHSPEVVSDIGAWRGRWTSALLHRCASVRDVTLFEPQPQAAAILRRMTFNCNVRVIQKALADRPGIREMRAGSASASLLEPQGLSVHFPSAVPTGRLHVECDTLDALVTHGAMPAPDTIKLDVQGAELEVIRGASRVLEGARALLLEMSWRPLYRDETEAHVLLADIHARGFQLVDASSGLRDASGKILQQDLLFLKD